MTDNSQGQRGTSAALGNGTKNEHLPFSCFAAPARAGAAKQEKGRPGFWGGYPGWRSLRSSTLGYYRLALSGRQMVPSRSGMGSYETLRNEECSHTPGP